MKRDINYLISILLLIFLILTGITGYIQSKLDLRKFIPHYYFAYITLLLATIHVISNIKKLYHYFYQKFFLKFCLQTKQFHDNY